MTLAESIIIGKEIHLHLGNRLSLSINGAVIFVEELDINLVMMHSLLRSRLLLRRADSRTRRYIERTCKGEKRANHPVLITRLHAYGIDTIAIKAMGAIFPRCILKSEVGLIVQGQFHMVIRKGDMVTLPGIDKRAAIAISVRGKKKRIIGTQAIKKRLSADALGVCVQGCEDHQQEAERETGHEQSAPQVDAIRGQVDVLPSKHRYVFSFLGLRTTKHTGPSGSVEDTQTYSEPSHAPEQNTE